MISLRKAINNFCISCIVDPGHGNGQWRQQVAACTSETCPLWPVRPISKPKSSGGGEVPEALLKWRKSQEVVGNED